MQGTPRQPWCCKIHRDIPAAARYTMTTLPLQDMYVHSDIPAAARFTMTTLLLQETP